MTVNEDRNVLLVTGARGGIARATLPHLRRAGYRFVLTDLGDSGDIAAELGESVVYHAPCDLASTQSVDAFLDDVLARTDVNLVLNNAAYQAVSSVEDMNPETFALYQRVNVVAPYQIVRRCAPGMQERGWGRVVNIVSGTPWGPAPGLLGYRVSKTALIGLTRGLAYEYGPDGITVNAITPALTRHVHNADALPEEVWAQAGSRSAIKRLPAPDELAPAIIYLLSEENSFMTGQTIAVDGGSVML